MKFPDYPRTGQPVNAQWAKQLLDYLRSITPRSSASILVSTTPNGTTYDQRRSGLGGGGFSSTPLDPWKVLSQAHPSNPGEWQAKVVLNSHLMLSSRPTHRQVVTGLDTWFPLLPEDAIWLGVVFDSLMEPTSASVDSWGQADEFDLDAEAWTYGPSYVDDDGEDPPVFQSARIPIATSQPGASGEPVLTQHLTTNLILTNQSKDGRACRYFQAWGSPYVPAA